MLLFLMYLLGHRILAIHLTWILSLVLLVVVLTKILIHKVELICWGLKLIFNKYKNYGYEENI